MKMKEGENIIQYSKIIKESLSAIRATRGIIIDEIMVNKVLRTPLFIYAIRVLAIQEMRCNPKNNITLDVLEGRLTFELENFDNYAPNPRKFESTLKDKLILKRKWGNSKGK